MKLPPDRHTPLALVAVAGQVLFTASWVVAALAEPGYSTADQTVSELFSRPAAHPWIVQAGIAALVPSYLAAAVLARRLGATLAPLLFVVAAPLAVVVLAAPLDCMTNGDAACSARAAAGDVSDTHRLHNGVAVLLQLCLAATPFAVARAVRGDRRRTAVSVLWGAIGVAAIAAYVIASPGDHGYGWAQRAMFLSVAGWIGALVAISRRSDGSRDVHRGFARRSPARGPGA